MEGTDMQSSAALSAELLEGLEKRSHARGALPTFLDRHIQTHFSEIDAITQGLRRGSLMVLAGSTGMGKTALALNLARNMSLHSHATVLYGACDSPAHELLPRMLASMCGIESCRIRGPRLTESEWPLLGDAIAAISSASLFFMDSSACFPDAIRQRCAELRDQSCSAPMVLILDHLQLLPQLQHAGDQDLRPLLQEHRKLAVELDLCLILLCQIPPHAELRYDHRPLLNDLPCVAAMQTYAHVIAVLHRDEYWNADSAARNQVELIFLKNTDNPVGTVRLDFEPQFSRFLLTRKEEPILQSA
ncbi:DnaB-like helicase C-terminal domain-containing protein [Cyanobium sp. HWJ4-Hawea]|uniref:DnaB-like helicase C-terminal domain-containing protein n=1 Tax=Cyanobium sp. HWJ4-Hawea TaxID=2823713 RepID=UPI0020CEDFA5|nr:DnaB-like helicase C-terminal domain-containing protein [Cyanobium sp. HWJ4-Hawea]MCP9807872.1 DnaB-like helicase C-terminal domain-containing protein [Cyanobium sp. HWJ4-Hawea]